MKTLEQLPDHSRVWIYQAPRFFNNSEAALIKEKAKSFLQDWSSHNNQMDAALEVFHNLFVVIAVDEQTAPASGCGIDKSVRFIKSISDELHVDLLNRTGIAYRDKGILKLTDTAHFKDLFTGGLINESSRVFNNLVQTLGELRKNWETTVGHSWQKNLL
jgi:hypothetical protein